MPSLKAVRLVLWAAVAATALGSGALLWQNREAVSESAAQVALVGGPFELVTTGGEPITEAALDGKPYALFFGFTNCPDVCPMTVNEVSLWIDALGDDADDLRFGFVSVDPERDTPEKVSAYVSSFSDRIIPMTGSVEQIEAVKRDYRVFSQKVPLAGGGYTVDHTSAIYLMDENGVFAGSISYGETEDVALRKLRRLL